MQPDIDYRLKPSRDLLDDWLLNAWGLWVMSFPLSIGIAVVFLDPSRAMLAMSVYWSLLWAAIPSLAFGFLVTAIRHRTASFYRVFRPTRARLLCMFGFWLVMPIAHFAFFPISAGFVGIPVLIDQEPSLFKSNAFQSMAVRMLGISYLIACLLCHSIPNIGRRLAAYFLIWLGFYSTAVAVQMLIR